MAKAKVLVSFYDAVCGVDRNVGDEFTCSHERINDINAAGYGKLVERIDDPKKKTKKEKQ